MTEGPLHGIRVLDLTIAMAGPLCTQRMGEMGAEIIKIEAPGGGDFSRHAPMAGVTKFGDATCFTTLNQNKKSLVLDLKSDEGRKILYQMAEDADVLVQNFRPRVARKLGIDFETLHAINRRLVVGAISGYGDEGPMKDRPGQDLLLQCFTGLTMNGGSTEGLPQASPLYMVDVTASHMMCEGVLAALIARGRTGEGQEVKVTMMGAIMEMQCQEIATWLAGDEKPQRGTSPQVSIYQEPPYGIYACKGGYFAIAQADLDVLADALNVPKLAELKAARPQGADGASVALWRDEVYATVGERLRDDAPEAWDDLLAPLGVWCMIVQDYEAFLNHEQTQTRLTRLTHPVGGDYTAVAPGISFSDQPNPQLTPAPLYGSDSRAVLAGLGLSPAEIDRLVAAGIVIGRDAA